MTRALLIANPVAARTHPRTEERVAQLLRRAGWGVDLARTTAPGDARVLAAQAVTTGAEVVAVFGGDGTTMQAAAALVGTDVALGFLPGGTGNLLAGNLRIPTSPIRAARVMISGRRRHVDLGRVRLGDGAEHYFGVACGAGADAWVMGGTAARAKRRWGMFAYVGTTLMVLPRLRNTESVIRVDGQAITMDAVLILIQNCGEIIPRRLRIRPETNPQDGLLDLVAVSADSPWQGFRRVFWMLRQSYRHQVPESPYVRYARGTRFSVETAEPLPVQFDGDPCGVTPFTAEVVPRALTVLTD
ncbi:MAG: diacylglycerol/lipid kinase family protein [Gemmatimonadales bacterium]